MAFLRLGSQFCDGGAQTQQTTLEPPLSSSHPGEGVRQGGPWSPSSSPEQMRICSGGDCVQAIIHHFPRTQMSQTCRLADCRSSDSWGQRCRLSPTGPVSTHY